jgi:hypothetical protein
MKQFQFGQFHIGQLLSYLVLGLSRPGAVQKPIENQPSFHSGTAEARTSRVPSSSFPSESPGEVLRATQRRWPSRYY